MSAGRASDRSHPVRVEVIAVGVCPKEPDRRLHILDLRGEMSLAAVAVVDHRHRVPSLRQIDGLGSLVRPARHRAPSIPVDPDNHRLAEATRLIIPSEDEPHLEFYMHFLQNRGKPPAATSAGLTLNDPLEHPKAIRRVYAKALPLQGFTAAPEETQHYYQKHPGAESDIDFSAIQGWTF